MKIQCDVCNKEEASVFCTADEAALCDGCDHRVHHANKLASKHHRFSLLSPSSKEVPLCDICQEKRGFLFCQQDRAILCRDCDVPIHMATEHTRKHNRFLLTGTKISATSSVYHSRAASTNFDTVPDFRAEASTALASAVTSQPQKATASTASSTVTATVGGNGKDKIGNSNISPLLHHHHQQGNYNGSTTSSSISDYLMEMLPGWHFEDFLDSCSASFGFCKNDHEGYLSLPTDEMSSFSSSSSLGIWVPQAPPPPPLYCSSTTQISAQINNGVKEPRDQPMLPIMIKQHSNKRPWSDNDVFAVPQISPSTSTAFKRSRHGVFTRTIL